MVADEPRIDLSKYRELKGDNVMLSKFCGIPAAKRAKLSKRTMHAQARGENSVGGIFSLVNSGDKIQVRMWSAKYREMAKIVKEFILVGWYSGTPVTRHVCYETAIEKCVIVGQNILSTETKPFNGWLESLNENALYKALLRAHPATRL